nr:MAG TPA: hypothetical protein [Caudoviricetes sp.]
MRVIFTAFTFSPPFCRPVGRGLFTNFVSLY